MSLLGKRSLEQYEEDINEDEYSSSNSSTRSIYSEITLDNLVPESSGFKLKSETKIRDDQLIDLNKMVNQYYQLVCNEMGTGKTILGILSSLHNYDRDEYKQPALIVTSINLQMNWKKELDKHFIYPESYVLILNSKNIVKKYDFRKYVLVLITYDALEKFILSYQWNIWNNQRHLYDEKKNILKIGYTRQVRKCKDTWKTFDNFNFIMVPWSSMIVDEAQKYQNSTSLWYSTSNTIPAQRRYMLTATPLTNTIKNFENLLQWLRIDSRNYDELCEKNIICTTRNSIDELKEVHEALKMDICVYIESSFFNPEEKREYIKIEDDFIRDLSTLSRMDTCDPQYKELYGIILSHIIHMRQATISYHLTYGVDQATDILANIDQYPDYTTHKSTKMQMALKKYEQCKTGVVFCSEYTTALDMLEYTLNLHGHRTTYPKDKNAEKNKQMIDEWNKDNSSALLISLQRFSEGYDLPSARFMIALNPTFFATKLQQFFGRSMRIERVIDPETGAIVENKCIGIVLLIAETFETDYVYPRCIKKIFDNSNILDNVKNMKKKNTADGDRGNLTKDALMSYMNKIQSTVRYSNHKNHVSHMTIDESTMDIETIKKTLHEEYVRLITELVNKKAQENQKNIEHFSLSIQNTLKPTDISSTKFIHCFHQTVAPDEEKLVFNGPIETDACHYVCVNNDTHTVETVERVVHPQQFNRIVPSVFRMMKDNLENRMRVFTVNTSFKFYKVNPWLILGHVQNPDEIKSIDLDEFQKELQKGILNSSSVVKGTGYFYAYQETGLDGIFIKNMYNTKINQEQLEEYCRKTIYEFEYNMKFKMHLHDGRTMTIKPISMTTLLEELKLNMNDRLTTNKLVDQFLMINEEGHKEMIDRLNQIIFTSKDYIVFPYNPKIKIVYDSIEKMDIDQFLLKSSKEEEKQQQ